MWKTVKLGDVATIIAGQSPTGENYNNEGQGMPFYQGKKDYGDKFLKQPSVWTKSVTKIAIEGDVLMSVRAPVGALNIATQEICIGRGLAAIRAHTEIDKDYLFYALTQISDGLTGSSGAIFNSINKKQIESIEFSLPPLAEQQRIVAKLDAAFAEIHKAIEATEAKVTEVDKLKASLLSASLNGDAVMWKILSFEECLDKVKTTPKLPKKEYLEQGNFPVVSQEASLVSGYCDKPEMLFKIVKPIIVFGDHTQILKYIDFDFVMGADGVKILQPIEKLNPRYFYYFLTLNMPKSTGYARHYRLLKELSIPLPPLAEQQSIVEKLDSVFNKADALHNLNKKAKANYQALKYAIIAKKLKSEKS